MKIENNKQYQKFLDKCDSNANVLRHNYPVLSFGVLVQKGEERLLYPQGEVTHDFRDNIQDFIRDLDQADGITIQIEHEQKVLQAIPFSFTPPKQASNMEALEVNNLLGNLPKQDQMLGTILQLNGKVEMESMKADYERRLQAMEFEKRELAAKYESLEKEKGREIAELQDKEKRYKLRLRQTKTQIEAFKSEDRALGNINIIKGVSKELAGAYLLYKSIDTTDEKKGEKLLTLAGILSGASALPTAQVEDNRPCLINERHDEDRIEMQTNLFQYLDSLDVPSFNYINKIVEFVITEENQPLIQKYINPVIHGTIKA